MYFIYYFIHQVLIECLLCARTVLSDMNRVMNTINKIAFTGCARVGSRLKGSKEPRGQASGCHVMAKEGLPDAVTTKQDCKEAGSKPCDT